MSRGTGALLIVDVQRDFCAGGALAVPGAEAILPSLNRLIERFADRGAPVYASRDWHPRQSAHFADQGGTWPTHCVAGTAGAAFHPELRLPADVIVVSKGITPTSDGYSAFDGTTAAGDGLRQDLERRQVRHVTIGGLATDYCVRASALGALQAGFTVEVVTDAIAGVDLTAGDSERALAEMAEAGAKLVRLADGPAQFPA